MRARKTIRGLDPTVIFWMAVGWLGFAVLPWYGLDGNFFTLSLAVRRLSARRRRRAGAVPGRCRARSSGWRRSASCCWLPLLLWNRQKSDPLFGRLLIVDRRGRVRLFPAAGLRHRPARLAVRVAGLAVRAARRPPVRHGLRRAAGRRRLPVPVHARALPAAARSAATSSWSARSASSSPSSRSSSSCRSSRCWPTRWSPRKARYSLVDLPRKAVQREAVGHRLRHRRHALRRRLELAVPGGRSSAC